MAKRKLRKETPQQAAQKWAAGYAASGPAITAAMNDPNLPDPTQLAIAQQQVMIQQWNASVTSGRWASALKSAGKQAYVQGMLQKTVPSVAVRANAGSPHYAAFIAAWGPAVQSQVQQLPPRGDYAANKARANAMMDWQHSQKGKFKKLWRQQGAPFAP